LTFRKVDLIHAVRTIDSRVSMIPELTGAPASPSKRPPVDDPFTRGTAICEAAGVTLNDADAESHQLVLPWRGKREHRGDQHDRQQFPGQAGYRDGADDAGVRRRRVCAVTRQIFPVQADGNQRVLHGVERRQRPRGRGDNYWGVNLVQRQLEVYRDPVADPARAFGFRYNTRTILDPGDQVTPLAAPQAQVAVDDLFP